TANFLTQREKIRRPLSHKIYWTNLLIFYTLLEYIMDKLHTDTAEILHTEATVYNNAGAGEDRSIVLVRVAVAAASYQPARHSSTHLSSSLFRSRLRTSPEKRFQSRWIYVCVCIFEGASASHHNRTTPLLSYMLLCDNIATNKRRTCRQASHVIRRATRANATSVSFASTLEAARIRNVSLQSISSHLTLHASLLLYGLRVRGHWCAIKTTPTPRPNLIEATTRTTVHLSGRRNKCASLGPTRWTSWQSSTIKSSSRGADKICSGSSSIAMNSWMFNDQVNVNTQLWHPHQDRPEATRVRLNRGWAASLSPARTCATHYTYIRRPLHLSLTRKNIVQAFNTDILAVFFMLTTTPLLAPPFLLNWCHGQPTAVAVAAEDLSHKQPRLCGRGKCASIYRGLSCSLGLIECLGHKAFGAQQHSKPQTLTLRSGARDCLNEATWIVSESARGAPTSDDSREVFRVSRVSFGTSSVRPSNGFSCRSGTSCDVDASPVRKSLDLVRRFISKILNLTHIYFRNKVLCINVTYFCFAHEERIQHAEKRAKMIEQLPIYIHLNGSQLPTLCAYITALSREKQKSSRARIRERTYEQRRESKICCESERSSSVRVERDILGDVYVGLTSTVRVVRSYIVRVKSASSGTSRPECVKENQWIQRPSRTQGQPGVGLDQEKISISCGESGGPAFGRCVCESYAPTCSPGLRSSRLPSTGPDTLKKSEKIQVVYTNKFTHVRGVLTFLRVTDTDSGSDRITISRSPRRGLTRLAIDGAQHSHDEVRSENHTHKRAPDAGAKAQQERMMAPEARTTLTR
ncbi:unnamed protein product, partial [Trichogramma brassicae]